MKKQMRVTLVAVIAVTIIFMSALLNLQTVRASNVNSSSTDPNISTLTNGYQIWVGNTPQQSTVVVSRPNGPLDSTPPITSMIPITSSTLTSSEGTDSQQPVTEIDFSTRTGKDYSGSGLYIGNIAKAKYKRDSKQYIVSGASPVLLIQRDGTFSDSVVANLFSKYFKDPRVAQLIATGPVKYTSTQVDSLYTFYQSAGYSRVQEYILATTSANASKKYVLMIIASVLYLISLVAIILVPKYIFKRESTHGKSNEQITF